MHFGSVTNAATTQVEGTAARIVSIVLLALTACGGGASTAADAGSAIPDAGRADGAAAPPDSGATSDAAELGDAGAPDGASRLADAGVVDAWVDPDAGPPCAFASMLQAATDAELARQVTTPGVTLGIDMPGCTWLGAAGVSDRVTGRAMTTTDAMRIASITKTFTAAVILQLIAEGGLHFSDSLRSFVAFPGVGTITVRNLLAHTSGIYDYYNSAPVLASLGRSWTHEEVIDVARAQPLAFVPGTMQQYSNTNYYLLGMIIESVTGHPYEVEVRSRLLAPLDLHGTYVAGVESPIGTLARGYDHTSGTPMDVTDLVDPSLTWAAGGIVSTAPDLLVWTRALLAGGVLSPTMRDAMLTPEPLTGGGTGSIGLGIQTQDLPGALGRFDSHLGRLQGYYGMVGYLVAQDTVTVQLTNDQDGAPNPFMTDMWMVVGFL